MAAYDAQIVAATATHAGEPRPRLVGQPARDGERGPPAGDEAGGDQQQAAALADLVAGPLSRLAVFSRRAARRSISGLKRRPIR